MGTGDGVLCAASPGNGVHGQATAAGAVGVLAENTAGGTVVAGEGVLGGEPGHVTHFGQDPPRDHRADAEQAGQAGARRRDPVQQQVQPGQRVAHPEPAAHHLGDPGQRPALVFIPAPRRRASRQRRLQLAQLRRAELAPGPARALRRQRRPPARSQRPPPPVRRHPRHPEIPGHLPVTGLRLDQPRRG
jgi:hypothetical protein